MSPELLKQKHIKQKYFSPEYLSRKYKSNKYILRLVQIFGNLSIRKKFAMLMIMMAVFTISVIGFTSYKVSEGIMEKSFLKSTSTLIELASNILETNLTKVDEISINIISDYDVQSIVRGEVTSSERFRIRSRIYSMMNNFINSNVFIDSIALFSFSDSSFIYSPSQQKKSEQQDFMNFIQTLSTEEIISFKGKPMWIGINNKNNDVVSLIRVVNIYEKQEKMGIICINVKKSIFNSVSNTLNISSESAIFLKDKRDTLIFGQFENENLQEYAGGEDNTRNQTANQTGYQFVSIKGSKYYQIDDIFPLPDWNIEVYIPSKEIFAASNIIKTSILSTVLISILITMLMVFILSDFITRPILKLRKIMSEVEKGDFSKRFDVRYKDEIGFLGKSFNSMVQQIKEYIEEIYENYQRIKESELEALQMKINPHFLYNNLNTINWMAQDIKAENIEILSRALTNYFRLSLSKGNYIITVQEEIEQLNNYLIIQKMRYEEYISFSFDIDEEIYCYKIVKLTLQPIVENAIFHGIEGKNGYGNISISAKMYNGMIVFEISDNGIGMTEQKLKDVRESLLKQKSIGYGIRNVNERIKLYFGEFYGLEIFSEYNKGTTVRVSIPIRGENDHSNESTNC